MRLSSGRVNVERRMFQQNANVGTNTSHRPHAVASCATVGSWLGCTASVNPTEHTPVDGIVISHPWVSFPARLGSSAVRETVRLMPCRASQRRWILGLLSATCLPTASPPPFSLSPLDAPPQFTRSHRSTSSGSGERAESLADAAHLRGSGKKDHQAPRGCDLEDLRRCDEGFGHRARAHAAFSPALSLLRVALLGGGTVPVPVRLRARASLLLCCSRSAMLGLRVRAVCSRAAGLHKK
jgi:hypothetical protein